MPPVDPPDTIPLSAPGFKAERPITAPPAAGPRHTRRARGRAFRHVVIEAELGTEARSGEGEPLLERLQAWLTERKVEEDRELLTFAAGCLHGLAAKEFRRVDRWSFDSGAWLLPRNAPSPEDAEPVGELLKELEAGPGPGASGARSFSARLSDRHGNHVDLQLHRPLTTPRATLRLELEGTWTKPEVDGLMAALGRRLPVARSEIQRFQYAPAAERVRAK